MAPGKLTRACIRPDGLSSAASTNPQDPPVYIIQGKGEYLSGGVTGLVERLDSEDVVKSA